MFDLKLVRFLLVGLGNTLIGLLIIYALKLTGVRDVPANAFGYAAGIVISFSLNKQWTFRYKSAPWGAFGRFLLVTVLAYSGNLLAVLFAIHVVQLNGFLAQIFGIPVYTFISYVGSRYYVFAGSSPTGKIGIDPLDGGANPRE